VQDSGAPTDLPSLQKLRDGTSPAGTQPFPVGIVIGPGFIPMDMVGSTRRDRRNSSRSSRTFKATGSPSSR